MSPDDSMELDAPPTSSQLPPTPSLLRGHAREYEWKSSQTNPIQKLLAHELKSTKINKGVHTLVFVFEG